MKESLYCGLLGSMEIAIMGERILIRATAGSSIGLSWSKEEKSLWVYGAPKGTV